MTTVDSSNVLEKIEQLKGIYFENNKKNVLFKKSQKDDCARYISENIDINLLIEKTVYIIPNTNIITFDYPVFKLYANGDNYTKIIDHIMNLFDYAIKYHNNFEVNYNLESFTVSAAERYVPAVKEFCNRCLSQSTKYSDLMNIFRILNTPAVMDMIIQIFKPFAEKTVIQKLVLLKKDETAKYLSTKNL
jgi:hypothetical protein